ELEPASTCHSPSPGFVKEVPAIRQLRKIVTGRSSKLLNMRRKHAYCRLLTCMTFQHFPLKRQPITRQQQAKLAISPVLCKRLEHPSRCSHPIERHFNNINPTPAPRQDLRRGVHRKGSRIVIRMAALVTVGQYRTGTAHCKC